MLEPNNSLFNKHLPGICIRTRTISGEHILVGVLSVFLLVESTSPLIALSAPNWDESIRSKWWLFCSCVLFNQCHQTRGTEIPAFHTWPTKITFKGHCTLPLLTQINLITLNRGSYISCIKFVKRYVLSDCRHRLLLAYQYCCCSAHQAILIYYLLILRLSRSMVSPLASVARWVSRTPPESNVEIISCCCSTSSQVRAPWTINFWATAKMHYVLSTPCTRQATRHACISENEMKWIIRI